MRMRMEMKMEIVKGIEMDAAAGEIPKRCLFVVDAAAGDGGAAGVVGDGANAAAVR